MPVLLIQLITTPKALFWLVQALAPTLLWQLAQTAPF
jgi:hypothetical protein